MRQPGSLAVTIGGVGLGVSVGASVATNDINNTVQAYISGATVEANSVDISSASIATIEALSIAVSISATVSMASLALSGGGAGATNTITNKIYAYISEESIVTATGPADAGGISIAATDTSTIDTEVGSGSLMFSPITGASVGASVSHNRVDNEVKAYISNSQVNSTNDGIAVTATSTADVDVLAVATSVALSASGFAGAGGRANAEITSIVEAYAGENAVLSAGGDIDFSAMSTCENTKVESEGISFGILASVGVSIADITISGQTRAYVAGMVSGANNLSITTQNISSPEAVAVAVSGGVLSGAGADADAHVKPILEAYTGDNSITVDNDITILALSEAAAEADAVGVAAGGISVGASLADAIITPTVNAYIGAGNITANNGSIRVGAFHNFESSGMILYKGADAHATAPGGSLIGSGLGADATSDASADLDTYVAAGATLSAGGSVVLTAMANNDAVAQSEGISGAIVASVGTSLADATAGGEIRSRMEGTITDADHLFIITHGSSDADAQAVAVSGGILSGAGADADANVTPVIEAFTGEGDITVSGDINIRSSSEGNAEADAVGVSVGGVSVGVSLADAVMTPEMGTHIGGGHISAGQDIVLGTYHNMLSDGTKLNKTADAHATAPGGALIGSGTGGDATSNASAILDTHVDTGATLTAGGDISVTSLANNDAVAGSEGISLAIVASVGTSMADATAGGEIKAHMDGTVINAHNLDISAISDNRGEADAIAVSGGVLAGNGAVARSSVSPNTEAGIGAGADIRVANNVAISSTADHTADAQAFGVVAGGVAVNGIVAVAETAGTVRAYLGDSEADDRLTLNAGSDLTITSTTATEALSYTDAYGGAIVGVDVAVSSASADPTINTFIGDNAHVDVAGDVILTSVSEVNASLDADGAGGAIVEVNVAVATAEVTPEINTHVGENAEITADGHISLTSRHNMDASGNVLDLGAASTINEGSGGLVNVGVLVASAISDADVETSVGSGSSLTATTGNIEIASLSNNQATAEANRYSGGAVDVGVLVSVAQSLGTTSATIADSSADDRTRVMGGGDLILFSSASNTAVSVTRAYGGAIVGVNVTVPTAIVNPIVNTSIGNNAFVGVEDTVLVAAVSNNSSSNTVTGGGGAAVAVDVAVIKAESTPAVSAQIGEYAEVTGGAGISVSSIVSENSVYASGTHSVGGAVAVDVLLTTANATADVEAYVDTGADLASNGNISVEALSAAGAISKTDIGSGGALSVNYLEANATIDGTTSAYVNDGAVVHNANTLEVNAETTHTASSDAYVGSGGAVEVRNPKATTILTPVTEAYIGSNVSVNVLDDVTINATSVRAEGNATATCVGGGGVDVGVAHAQVTTSPTVTGYIGSGSRIIAGDAVRVSATADSQGSSTDLSDEILGVDTVTDTIRFDQHGLIDGDTVYYDRNTGTLTTPNAVIADGREFSIIKEDDGTIMFGATFEAGDVDADMDVIVFQAAHKLETGDAVKYTPAEGDSISSDLDTTSTFYVRKIDDFTIKLFTSQSEAQASGSTFSTSDVASDAITIIGHGFTDGDAVTYSVPAATGFDSTIVDTVLNSDGTQTETDNNRIYVGRDTDGDNEADTGHNFNAGDKVIYRTDGDPIGDLVNGGEYYVIIIPGDTFYIQLAASYNEAVGYDPDPNVSGDRIPITPLALTPDKSEAGASVNHWLVPPGIGALEDGVTYYVTHVSGDSFQLADSDGTVLSLDTSDRFGTHAINSAGIDLNASVGTQELRIDLSSWTPGGRLLGPGETSLRLLSPPPGDGESYAKATGGAGGFAEIGVPTAEVTATHTVNAYVGAQLIDAGGDVEIASSSIGNVRSYAKNAAGGAIKVGVARAMTTFTNTSNAFVGNPQGASIDINSISGNNVTIQAGGDFILTSDFTMAKDEVDAIAHGGGVLAFAHADADATIINNTSVAMGTNAHAAARTARLEAKVLGINADAYGETKAGGITGTSQATGHVTLTSNVNALLQGNASTDTWLSGSDGVDIRTGHENITTDGHTTAWFIGIWLPPYPSSGETNTLASMVTADQGVTVAAGTRFTGSGLFSKPRLRQSGPVC